MQYAVVIEHLKDGSYSAYVPDLPSCTTFGDTVNETLANIRDAIDTYLDVLQESGYPVPMPNTLAEMVEV